MNDITDQEIESYPINEFQLTTTPNDFNISTIISFISSKVFKIPAFQRHYVWDIKRASKLIESLLIGLPIPQIFLYESGKNEFLVIDGQQRLMTLYYFFNGRFPKKEKRSELRAIFDEQGYIPEKIMQDDNYFQRFNLRLDGLVDGQENRFNGKNYNTLGESQMALNLATIRNMIIKPVATEDDEDGAMFEIFNRLNSGGMNLTPQEIRMSLYHSKFNVSLINLNENNIWRNTILGKDIVDMRLNDVEAILRTLAMVHSREEYKTTISGFLNTFSNATKSFSQEDTDFFKELWDSFMVACEGLQVEDFRTGASRLSITLFESVFYAACRSSVEQKNVNIPKITSEYLALLKSDDIFIESSTGKTTRRDSVVMRTDRARTLLQEYINGQ
ncbi:DUF262 domain-containing protein [Enterovibrio paralichthyis]|uniref:DUF262 domain-containing protein n=1 Tax=Enterovibrio paralichthyis TaxID=2853805 RepID=UPI001C454609|nr:DUF262 domain-containing protein [Enterovibrio paralichthyis]MBV7299301.1 DUF262 domain-containing protein [Enterovibrio paralichthyis]